jgi:hypothetical protein
MLHHISFFDLSRSVKFLQLSSKRQDFMKNWFQNRCVYLLSSTFICYFSQIKKKVGSHITTKLRYASYLPAYEFSGQFSVTNVPHNISRNPSSGSRIVPCEPTDGQTEEKRHDKYNNIE